MHDALSKADPHLAELIDLENTRQHNGIELIASENYTSAAVMKAVGSCLTNKYAEGRPGKENRYYGGCEVVDKIEALAIERGKQLFGAEHIDVQPHDGSGANRAIYRAAGLHASRKDIDQNRDVLVSLGAGVEHLTHGKKVSATGKDYEVHHYGLLPNSLDINIDEAAQLADTYKGRMKVLMLGHSSYPRKISQEVFAKLQQIAHDAGAKFAVDMAHFAGLVAGGVHDNPVPFADFVGSTTHKTLRGPRAGLAISKAAYAKDLERAVFPQLQGGPHMHVIAGKAACFHEAMQPSFQDYARRIIVNLRALADRLRTHGHIVLGGNEDANHLLNLDVAANGGPGGKLAEDVFNQAGLTVNKNMLPFDTRKALDPSGIRIGTPAATTRGMGPMEMQKIADWMSTILKNPTDASVIARTHNEVQEMCGHFPLPQDMVDA